MSLGTLSAFIDNFQRGQQASRQSADWRQQQDAIAALGRFLSQGEAGPVPQVPAMPQSRPTAPQAMPIAMAPQTLARLSPEARTGLDVVNGQRPPIGGPMPAPGSAQSAPPPAGAPVDPGLSSTAQPNAPGMDDPVAAGQQSIRAIAASIKAANPGIDPRTLAMAVTSQIENIKGVSPLTRAAMQSQMRGVEIQQRWQIAGAKLQSEQEYHAQQLRIMAQRGATQADAERERERHNRAVEDIQRSALGTRLEIAEMGQAGETERQDRRDVVSHEATVGKIYDSVYGAYLRTHPGEADKAAAVARAAAKDATRAFGDAPSGQPDPRPSPRSPVPKPSPKNQRADALRGRVKVNGPDDIRKLAKGTPWVSADGSRQGIAP